MWPGGRSLGPWAAALKQTAVEFMGFWDLVRSKVKGTDPVSLPGLLTCNLVALWHTVLAEPSPQGLISVEQMLVPCLDLWSHELSNSFFS